MAKRLPPKNFTWSPELAYAAGLLATDGNLSIDGRHICFRSNDIELIDIFKKCLSLRNRPGTSVNKGSEKNISYKLQFGNVQFYNWLLKIGLSPCKSHTIAEINIPDQYFKDFLRGHLDGDGTILFYNDRYNIYRGVNYSNLRLYTEFISVSKAHIQWLHNKIITLAGVRAALIKYIPKDKNRVSVWTIKVAKKASAKLLPWIYYQQDLPTLERKRRIAMNALRLIAVEQRRPYTFI